MSQRDKSESAILIQKLFRGHRQRKKVRIKTEQTGIIHIRIRGDSELFESLGIEGIDSQRPQRLIDILSIDQKRYQSRVIGGQSLFNPVSSSSDERMQRFGTEVSVFINASFFNSDGFFSQYPESATIGPVHTSDNNEIESVPIAPHYREDYCSVRFKDNSLISSAPLLTKNGLFALREEKLSKPYYQYDTIRGKQCPPGSLYHLGDPNPRAAISFPSKTESLKTYESAHQDRIRFAAAIATSRGPNSDGCTILEWAHIMTRVSNLNIKPGHALNLDGGASVTMGIIGHNGNKVLEIAQAKNGRDNSTFIVYSQKRDNELISSSTGAPSGYKL